MRIKVVADSCSLILLAKCNLLEIFSESFSVMIPNEVFREVVNKNLPKKFPDSIILSDLVSSKKIEVVSFKGVSQKPPISLGKGEWAAIKLSGKTAGSVLATDDGKAIKICRYMKVPFIISPKIVMELYQLGKISFSRARSSIEKMRIIGRYSPDIIAETLLELEVIRNAEANNG